MVSKFTEKDLEKLEAEAELKVYREFQAAVGGSTGLPRLTPNQEKDFKLGCQKCSPLVWEFFEKASPSVRQKLFSQAVFNAILSDNGINRYELVNNNLEKFMFGAKEGAGPTEKQAYRAFKYYKELSVEAMRYFLAHFEGSEYFGFATSAYEQWFASLKLGLYSAPERVLSGVGSLNYPDLKPAHRSKSWKENEEYSPRLDNLKAYLEVIYELRVKCQFLDLLIRQAPKTGSSPNVSMGQWEKFTSSIRTRLAQKFGSVTGEKLFKKMFGSVNPTAPTSQSDFNAIQNEVLEQVAQALFRGQVGGDPLAEPSTPSKEDPFRRDYAKEQHEREAREAENKRQKEREQAEQDWSDLNSQFRNNPDLVKQWTDKNFTKSQTKEWIDIGFKPTESEYAQFLRDIKKLTPEQVLNEGNLEQIKQEYEQWKNKSPKEKEKDIKENNPPEPEQKPKSGQSTPKRSPSPSRQAAQDKLEGKETPPPKHTEFNSSPLNEALNSLTGALEEDKKDNPTFDGSLPPKNIDMAGKLTKEEKDKLPWLCMGIRLAQEKTKTWNSWKTAFPYWKSYSPHSVPFGGGGSGDYVTLLLELRKVSRADDFSDTLHNFFWAKNLGTEEKPIKGFARLVKDEDLPAERERERERQLLITGTRANDLRADKLGWTSWPWDKKKKIIDIGVPGVKQKSYRFTRWMRNQNKAYDLEDTSHFIGILKSKGLMGDCVAGSRQFRWGLAPKRSILWITNQTSFRRDRRDWLGDDPHTINPHNGFSHYLIFTNQDTSDIQSLNCKTLPELVGKLKGTLVRLGPDDLELMETLTPNQKETTQNETPASREKNRKEVSDQDLADMEITREEFDLLNTAFADPAHIANIIKKIANGKKPEKVAEMLNRMYNHLNPKTAQAMFNQMVDNNPVFNQEEKEKLKKTYQEAKTSETKKKVWETLTSHQAQREAHKNKTKAEKDKIFEDQVNQNPRYGPPGEDTQARRDRFTEYEKANETQKETMQQGENQDFTHGQNANQWGDYFQSNATYEAGGGDESVGTESDNNFNGNFSFKDSLEAINKLKNLGSMKPEGMEEGMKSNKPYWEVIFAHPLTYIFLFIGLLVAIMAATVKKNKN